MMKPFYCFLSALLFSNMYDAQWTIDPGNPMVVCNEMNSQNAVQTFPDGNDGYFVFWKDQRQQQSHADIYAQHYNSAGLQLWDNGGREILNYEHNISMFDVHVDEETSEIFIASATASSPSEDSVRVRKLDFEGVPVWTNDVLLSKADPCVAPSYIIEYYSVRIESIGDHLMVLFESNVCGGFSPLNISVLTTDGEMITPLYGETLPGGGTDWYTEPVLDNSGDFFLVYATGNGAGADVHLNRIQQNGDVVFGSVSMLTGTSGLGYNFQILSDSNGVVIIWEGGGNINARKFDNNGNDLWGETIEICSAEGTQEEFFAIRSGENIYIIWRDARPGIVGNYAIYGQRMTTNGIFAWQTDGIQIADLNTFTPIPKFEFDANGNLIVCHVTFSGTMTAHKVTENGTVEWSPEGHPFANAPYHPSTGDYNVVRSGENVIAAWVSTSGDNNVYVARLSPFITEVVEQVTACNSYTLNEVTYTESDIYEIMLPGDTLLTLHLTVVSLDSEITLSNSTLNSNGDTGNYTWINCDNDNIESTGASSFTPNQTGTYALVIDAAGCADTSNCVFVEVLGLNERMNQLEITMYPNPASDNVTIQSDKNLFNSTITILSADGKAVRVYNRTSGHSFQFSINQLSDGIYFIEIANNEFNLKKKLIIQ